MKQHEEMLTKRIVYIIMEFKQIYILLFFRSTLLILKNINKNIYIYKIDYNLSQIYLSPG